MAFVKVDAKKELNEFVKKNSSEEERLFELEYQYQFIRKLADMRRKMKVSQKELAERTGLTQQVISRIEKLDYSPSLNNLIKYVLGLGLKLDVLTDN